MSPLEEAHAGAEDVELTTTVLALAQDQLRKQEMPLEIAVAGSLVAGVERIEEAHEDALHAASPHDAQRPRDVARSRKQ